MVSERFPRDSLHGPLMSERKAPVAIIGSGNIGTDLMVKIIETSDRLRLVAMVGIDPGSDGLAQARARGIPTTSDGVEGFIAMDEFDQVSVVFDATSAAGHLANAAALQPHGKRLVDLTPAAIGPYVVPAVNLHAHLHEPDLNMVTCGGQATVPVVAAISSIVPVAYAEIVAAISSKSAGPGTRASIDEFTRTTAAALEHVGGAGRGKAIIVLNPAEPPVLMRDTVHCLIMADEASHARIRGSVAAMVSQVAAYVPGYRLTHDVQIAPVPEDQPVHTLLRSGAERPTHQVTVLLEVEGAAHYLPAYAGNLDIMTSAALQVGEQLVAVR